MKNFLNVYTKVAMFFGIVMFLFFCTGAKTYAQLPNVKILGGSYGEMSDQVYDNKLDCQMRVPIMVAKTGVPFLPDPDIPDATDSQTPEALSTFDDNLPVSGTPLATDFGSPTSSTYSIPTFCFRNQSSITLPTVFCSPVLDASPSSTNAFPTEVTKRMNSQDTDCGKFEPYTKKTCRVFGDNSTLSTPLQTATFDSEQSVFYSKDISANVRTNTPFVFFNDDSTNFSNQTFR